MEGKCCLFYPTYIFAEKSQIVRDARTYDIRINIVCAFYIPKRLSLALPQTYDNGELLNVLENFRKLKKNLLCLAQDKQLT